MTNVEFVVLWGDEHPKLGELAVDALTPDIGIALSAGRMPKPYWHLDANEDAVLAMSASDAVLLAVADGHNGFDAALAAVTGVYRRALAVLAEPVRNSQAAVEVLLGAAADFVEETIRAASADRRNARTALSLALIAGDEATAATFGDTTLVRIRSGKAKALTEASHFLGPDSPLPAVETVRVRAGDAIVACSDGLTDYLGTRWQEQMATIVTAASSGDEAARRLANLAMDAGAGDHIAVAVALIR